MTDFSLSQGVSALAALFAVHLLAVASPGPAFLAVSRTAIGASRSAGLVALVRSAPRPRLIYQNAKRGLDALFGGFLTALGLKLALER